MSGRRGNRSNYTRKPNPQVEQVVDSNNPVIVQFQIYASELDEKHDRHEKLVKASRDITIESKRIIFLLHNIDPRKNNKDGIIQEAESRIEKLLKVNFESIARELKGADQYLYLRAVSPGVQEFIEAYTFCEYLKGNDLPDWEDLNQQLTYSNEEVGPESYHFEMVPAEFVLGLADLTGEVMRNCINSLGSGDTDNCTKTCKFLQNIYAKYLGLNSVPKTFSQKISTMRASTLKCEQVCYNLMVRGTEGSKLVSFDNAGDDFDEGFYP